MGVPQGSLISPLLSNIYLNELDSHMEGIIATLSSQDRLISKVNPKIVTLTNKTSKLSMEYRDHPNLQVLKELRALRKERNKINSRIRTGNRIRYIRYADDWLVGIIGTLEFAQRIKDQIATFLETNLKLTMEQEKTKITHLSSKQAKFLGMLLWIPRSKNAKIVKKYNSKAGRYIKSRINQTRIYFAAPIASILKKLESQGIIKRYDQDRNRLIPNAITKLIFLDHAAIINRYNAIINGYLNYFSPVDNYSEFHQIIGYILRHSCAKTLARKFHLKTRAGAFKKFGKNLETSVTRKGLTRKYHLNIPNSFKKIRIFKTNETQIRDPHGNPKLQARDPNEPGRDLRRMWVDRKSRNASRPSSKKRLSGLPRFH